MTVVELYLALTVLLGGLLYVFGRLYVGSRMRKIAEGFPTLGLSREIAWCNRQMQAHCRDVLRAKMILFVAASLGIAVVSTALAWDNMQPGVVPDIAPPTIIIRILDGKVKIYTNQPLRVSVCVGKQSRSK